MHKFEPISWFTRTLLKISPTWGMRKLARGLGIRNPRFEQAEDLFRSVSRIDLFPSGSSSRGFRLVLDSQTALYFYQDGDHFVYDGYEMGEYSKGDVTILDRIGVEK